MTSHSAVESPAKAGIALRFYFWNRTLTHNVVPQVMPVRVELLYQPQFPFAIPLLQLFFRKIAASMVPCNSYQTSLLTS